MSPATAVCALIILCSASGNTELLSHFRHATIRAVPGSPDVPVLAALGVSAASCCSPGAAPHPSIPAEPQAGLAVIHSAPAAWPCCWMMWCSQVPDIAQHRGSPRRHHIVFPGRWQSRAGLRQPPLGARSCGLSPRCCRRSISPQELSQSRGFPHCPHSRALQGQTG